MSVIANKIDRRSIGHAGEAYVARRLQEEGFTIVAQNYTIFAGEIDVIAQKDDLVVFVEVKTRKNALIDPAYAITWSKQKKIIGAAQHFLSTQMRGVELTFRFDVALLAVGEAGQMYMEYIRNAFQAEE